MVTNGTVPNASRVICGHRVTKSKDDLEIENKCKTISKLTFMLPVHVSHICLCRYAAVLTSDVDLL